LGDQYFVGPDNGLLTRMLETAELEKKPAQIVHANNPDYWLKDISHVFHGRDIFSPVAAHLANGVALTDLGVEINDPVRFEIPKPERKGDTLHGCVIHIDYFGNVATNIRKEHLQDYQDICIKLGGQEICGIVKTFGERAVGDLITLYGSTGDLIVSVVNGNAAAKLGMKIGDPVEVTSFTH
jgi:hypothetical protein